MEVDCGGNGGRETIIGKDDLSCITVSRSDEIANIKLKYEDYIEQYKQ
jgi:hypothetical protein